MEHQGRDGGKNTGAVAQGGCSMLPSEHDIGITSVNSEQLQSLHTSYIRTRQPNFQHEWTGWFLDPTSVQLLAVDSCQRIIFSHGYHHWSPAGWFQTREHTGSAKQIGLSKTKRWKVVGGSFLEECWELESLSGGRCRIPLHTWRGITKSTVQAQG